jgi:hypothetical protein
MFLSGKSFFLRGGDYLAVLKQGRRAVMIESRNSQYRGHDLATQKSV